MTDEELKRLADTLASLGSQEITSTTGVLQSELFAAASAIRQLMEDLKQARIAGAWLYGLELERPADYAEQKPLAMRACRAAFMHPQALS